jgi:hypothetical protein
MSIAEVSSSPGDRCQRHADMRLIAGGTFRMGSDRHYPEEAPVHRVAVEGFLIDRTPVTNRQFKDFVRATGHVTFAEIPPDANNYPGALPHMLYAGPLVFSPPARTGDLGDWSQWWQFMKGADWRHPYGPKSNINVLEYHPVEHVAYSDAFAFAVRLDDFKYRFTDQPGGWLGGTVKVDWPILTNIRLDPFERTGLPNGDKGSLAFYNWFAYEFWRFQFVQQEVGKLAQTAIEFPPMQKGASFNLEAVKAQIEKAIQSHTGK